MCYKDILYYLKILSVTFSHWWIPNLQFIFVCGMKYFIFWAGKKMVHYIVALMMAYDKAVWHKLYGSIFELSRLLFIPRDRWPESTVSTTTYRWCDQRDCGSCQSLLVKTIRTIVNSWVSCLQAESCWWSQRALIWCPLCSPGKVHPLSIH